jgi:hypothetical protein
MISYVSYCNMYLILTHDWQSLTNDFGPCSNAQGRNFLDPVPVHRDENFGPCSSAQGRKILDPVPVHRDENFGPCSSAQGRKCFGYVNDEHLSSIQWWECHFISRFHWKTKLSMRKTKLSMGRQSSVRCSVTEVTQKTTSCPGKFIHTSTAFRATRLHVNCNIW